MGIYILNLIIPGNFFVKPLMGKFLVNRKVFVLVPL